MSKHVKKEAHSITPLGDNVLLSRIENKQESTSGIILPELAGEQSKLQYGKVVAVGEGSYKGEKLVPLTLKKGDEVLYSWGEMISFQGTEYVLTKESQIIAIVTQGFKK